MGIKQVNSLECTCDRCGYKLIRSADIAVSLYANSGSVLRWEGSLSSVAPQGGPAGRVLRNEELWLCRNCTDAFGSFLWFTPDMVSHVVGKWYKKRGRDASMTIREAMEGVAKELMGEGQ